jgi:hypothetical protein
MHGSQPDHSVTWISQPGVMSAENSHMIVQGIYFEEEKSALAPITYFMLELEPA